MTESPENSRTNEALDTPKSMEETAPGSSGRTTTARSTKSPEVLAVAPAVPATAGTGQVMTGITVRELEMLPKLEQFSKMKEIPVGGVTNIHSEVVGAIAGVAARSVEGVASLGTSSLRRTISERFGGAERRARGVQVEAGRREAILDIDFTITYGYSIPYTVVQIRERVAESLLKYTGLVAKEVNIRVKGIDFPTRSPGRVE